MQVWGNSFHFLRWLKLDFLIISSCLRRPPHHSPFSDLPLPFWSSCSERKVLYKPHCSHWWRNCTSALFFPFFSHPHFFLLLYQREENTFQQSFKYPSSKTNAGNIYVPVPFSQIIPPSPSPTESKSLSFTSVSLLQMEGTHGCLCQSHLVVSDSLWPNGLYGPWSSLGQNTRGGSRSLLQGIFPTQGSNPGLPHSRQIFYQLSHQGSPYMPMADSYWCMAKTITVL